MSGAGRAIPSAERHMSSTDKSASPQPGRPQSSTERKLDEAVEETFPASDPISVTISKSPEELEEERRRAKGGQQKRSSPAPGR